ncbi:LppM family (lipo)protein [Allorhizocola rhizosphaerae]|uniref:LppM family (lipo)protein n=1 Tax=Allorhizocola rhizosphaerae TaxID=1872709 RepID=UPI000E3D5FAD|nr:hypothetical protein [Allorhizocola rhizosphaerae]
MFRPLRAVAALVVAISALTGCMKIDFALTVDGERDVVNGSLVFAVAMPILTLQGQTPEQGWANVEDELSELPEGSRAEIYDDGTFYGRRIHFENMPFSEFNAAPEGPRIAHENGRYIFTFETNATELGDVATVPVEMLNEIQKIEYRVSVTFPGDVVERDDKAVLQGRTVTWTLRVSENHDLRAVAEEPEGFPWLLLGLVAGLFGLLVLAGIVALAMRMSRRPPHEPAPPAA